MSSTRVIEALLSLITPLAVILCAYFAASGVSNYVAARYVGEATAAERPVRRAPAAKPAAAREKDGAPLIDRNMFCSDCETSETTPELQVAAAGDAIPETSLPLQLVATAVSTDPSGSFATVSNTESSHKGAYWTGQSLPGAGEIKSVTGRWIDFVNPATNRVERLRLDRPAPRPEPEPTARDRRSPRRLSARAEAARKLEEEIAAKVKQVGANTWEVDRSILDFLRGNPTAARGVRVMPYMNGGKPGGFKITRLSSRSPVSKIGVQRGDVLTAVNGTRLTGPDKVLAMMTQLQTLNRVVVDVERRGKTVSLTYLIR